MNAELAPPRRGYIVCAIERTGSTLLTGGLIQSGVAGLPREYFNRAVLKEPWMREILGESTPVSGFEKIMAAGATPNGVFGAKLHWVHLRVLAETLAGKNETAPQTVPGSRLQRIPNGMPMAALIELLRKYSIDRAMFSAALAWLESKIPDLRFVWLTRRNMVARAISHYRAIHSGIWYQSQPLSGTAATESAPGFDFEEIHKIHALGLLQEDNWRWFFEHHSIAPCKLVYEDLVADYADTLRSVTAFLGVDYPVERLAPPASSRQADDSSKEWEDRYVEMSAKL